MTTAGLSVRPAPSALAANLFCMASMLTWAAGLPAAEILIGILPPLPLSAARMTLAAAVLLPVWWLAEPGAAAQTNWRAAMLVGLMLGIGGVTLVIGQGLTDPVTVAIISAAMPVIGTTIEVIHDGRRVTAALVLGIALSLAGALVALDPAGGDFSFGLGAGMMLSSVVLYAYASRLTITGLPRLSPLGRTTVTLSAGALVSVAAALADGLRGGPTADWGALGPQGWSALAVFAIGGLAISQLLWIKGLGRLGIALSSMHLNATPFYVMLIMLALGGDWNWRQAAGALLVGIGVLAAQNLLPFGRR